MMRFGIQDCSLRPVREKYGLFGSFAALSKAGFEGIEFAVWDKTLKEMHHVEAAEIRRAMDDAGMTSIGIHVDLDRLDTDPGTTIEECHVLDIKYAAVCPAFYGDRTPFNEQKRIYEKVVRVARMMKENGIQFQVHCAALGYLTDYQGRCVCEGMIEEAGPDLLQAEFDTAWMMCGGVDPAGYIRKYAGYVDLIHMKDFKCMPETPYILVRHNTVVDEQLGCAVGEGMLDVPGVIKAAGESGTKWLIGEFWDGDGVMDEACRSLANMKKYV